MSSQNEKVFANARYLYDALEKRIRFMEMGVYENKTFTMDALMLYREGVVYQIFRHNRTCKKIPFKQDFQPLGVPNGASLLGQVVLGSSSAPLEGLLVNSWIGDIPKGGKFVTTVTEFGCIPVTSLFQTDQYGWLMMSYYNNVIGISDPGELNPPDFCPDTEIDSPEEPVDLISLFFTKH